MGLTKQEVASLSISFRANQLRTIVATGLPKPAEMYWCCPICEEKLLYRDGIWRHSWNGHAHCSGYDLWKLEWHRHIHNLGNRWPSDLPIWIRNDPGDAWFNL